jgi:metallo-beta-lactamase class B
MFASALIAALAQQIVLPLGGAPQQVERLPAPIEQAGPRWAAACAGSDDWEKPAPPVRIHGNTYLVGTCGIAAILVTGNNGHILIDAGTEPGAEQVAANIKALGFKLADVKYLLHSHEHFDHVGGTALLQKLTGATLIASAPAARVFASGTATPDDPQAGMHPPLRIANVGRVIADGETVRLGNLLLTAMATPGHTPGALSWSWESCDGGVCRSIVFADSLSAVSRDNYRFSAHPQYLAAFRAGIAKVGASRCEILLTPHPSASGLPAKLAAGKPWVDPAACRSHAATLNAKLDERLAKEAAK